MNDNLRKTNFCDTHPARGIYLPYLLLVLLAGAVVAYVPTASAVDEDLTIRKDSYTNNGYEIVEDGVVKGRLKPNKYLPEGYYDLYDDYGRKMDSYRFDYDDGYGDGYDSWGSDE